MLETKGLTLHYGGSQILHGIDFTARVGEVTCIMGTNGVGKTSFLKALAGTHPRSGGTVQILLLDEPTEGIQPAIISQIGRVITYLKSTGTVAIVLVEQYRAALRAEVSI
jgi:ABC-type branched-subunit amino acid transport system ATPase component